jgi:hypothetical protein
MFRENPIHMQNKEKINIKIIKNKLLRKVTNTGYLNFNLVKMRKLLNILTVNMIVLFPTNMKVSYASLSIRFLQDYTEILQPTRQNYTYI